VELEASSRQNGTKWKRCTKLKIIIIEVIASASTSNWPWFEHFDNIFFGIGKISGIFNAIDQGVHVMNSETKVVNVCDEHDLETTRMPNSFEKQIPMFGDALYANSNSPRTRAYKLPVCARVT
jgi:hypothetical protein